MIPRNLEVEILRLHDVERWKVGTIAAQLGVHHDVVRRVLKQGGVPRPRPQRPARIDAYLPLILDALERYPRLPASRLFAMCCERGYRGSPDHFRHMVARHRPPRAAEAFLRLNMLPGEYAQVDWGHFGRIKIGRAERALMAFVMVLAYSRRIFLRFYLDQRTENFLRGHVAAFDAWQGTARVLLYDNLKSAVLERRGDAIRFNPLIIELANHYHFEARPVAIARGNEKGRVERAIRYVRTSFWPARVWRDIDDLNAQADAWCDGPAMARPWPQDRTRTVTAAFDEERPRLLPLPATPFHTEERAEVRAGKTPHVRFDRNDYSVPHGLARQVVEVRASLDRVRVVAGTDIVADHSRCFDSGRTIDDPAHVQDLWKAKGELRRHRALDRLSQAVPSSQELFVRIAERGLNVGRMTQLVARLLAEHGAVRMEQAVREMLASEAFDHHALRHVLERMRREDGRAPAVAVQLPDDPRVRNMSVSAPKLASYDELLGRGERTADGTPTKTSEEGDHGSQV